MPCRRISRALFAALALLCVDPGIACADKFPDYLPAQFQPFFARYVDSRSLPERMLNTVGLTANEYGRSFALVAGISKYPHVNGAGRDLEPAGEDVRKIVNYLTTYEKFDEVVVLKDTDVTESNFSFLLQRYFPRRLQEFPKSRFLFAYSGHGVAINNKSYILTADAQNLTDRFNGISMATLRAMFQQVADSGYHVLALINACYSGDFLKRSFGNDRRFVPRYPGAHAITAGGTKELTWHDGSVGTGSLFFEKFFAALDGRAGRDGIVTVDELAAYLRREVQISTDQRQNPLPGDLSRDGSLGGFFFFNRQPLVEANFLPAWDASKGIPFGTRSEDRSSGRAASDEDNSQTRTRIAALLSEAYGRGKSGEYDRAIANYSEAIRLDPKFARAFVGRGTMYHHKKDYDRAISDYSEAIRLDPKYAIAVYNRGGAYNGKNDSDRAISDFSEAIRLDPKFAIAIHSRGNAYNSKKDYDRAINDYSEAIRLDPKLARAFANRGSAYDSKKDYDRAISDYSEAIRLDPKYSSAFSLRGTAYYNKKDYDRAISNYSEAIRLDPNNAAAYYNRGLAKRIKGDTVSGDVDVAKGRQLNPDIGK